MTVSSQQESIDGMTAGRDGRNAADATSTRWDGHVRDTSVELNELALRDLGELVELEANDELDIYCYPESN